jgi:hypothetical protein
MEVYTLFSFAVDYTLWGKTHAKASEISGPFVVLEQYK